MKLAHKLSNLTWGVNREIMVSEGTYELGESDELRESTN